MQIYQSLLLTKIKEYLHKQSVYKNAYWSKHFHHFKLARWVMLKQFPRIGPNRYISSKKISFSSSVSEEKQTVSTNRSNTFDSNVYAEMFVQSKWKAKRNKGETKAIVSYMGLGAYNGPRSRCAPLGGERVASAAGITVHYIGAITALLSSTLTD